MNAKDQARCEVSRREFYIYCRTLYPNFYKKERKYLKELCNEIQSFYFDDTEFMIINAPPRHGKSFTAQNFVEWVFGVNPREKIMSASYNDDLSRVFSKKSRSTIATEKVGDNTVYSDIFPNTKLKYGSAEAHKWQIEGNDQVNYLSTSPNGSATGFGCTFMIIDDLIKNAQDANNATQLENQWSWFTNTMLSRREGKKKVLIIMTRWNSNDLAGKILEYVKEKGLSYRHINYKAMQDDGTMLCDDIFNKRDYDNAMDLMGEDIFSANYQQEPLDLKGRLYEYFQEYEELPNDIQAIENYTDTADEGKDYLCSINYAVSNKKAYILDILYTKESMEITEKKVAAMLVKDNVNWFRPESNNGGRGFGRNVMALTHELGNNSTIMRAFHQSANKESRILTNSTGVMRNIYFPKGWNKMYKEFYKEVSTYQREGKNKHDDGTDTITGINEVLTKRYSKNGGWD